MFAFIYVTTEYRDRLLAADSQTTVSAEASYTSSSTHHNYVIVQSGYTIERIVLADHEKITDDGDTNVIV